MTTTNSIYAAMVDLKISYKRRVLFFSHEYNRLKSLYFNNTITEDMYMRRLCPLLNEKRRIKSEYQQQVQEYIQQMPKYCDLNDLASYFDDQLNLMFASQF